MRMFVEDSGKIMAILELHFARTKKTSKKWTIKALLKI